MSDLVMRLRESCGCGIGDAPHVRAYAPLLREAADEIERLRVEVAEANGRWHDATDRGGVLSERLTDAQALLGECRLFVDPMGFDDDTTWLRRALLARIDAVLPPK